MVDAKQRSMATQRENPGAGGAFHGLLPVPDLPAAPEPIAEKVYAAERAVASVRLAVAVFSIVIYFALPDRALTIPWLAWPTIVVALTYSLLVVVFEPYRRFPILLSSYATTAADALLIALWLVATGGVYSPFYVIWYGSVVAIAFRFDIRGSLVASTLYTVLYLAVLAALGQLSGHLFEATLRSGYMLFIAILATLLGHYAVEQERAKVANHERELAAERTEKYFRELLESAPDANVMTDRSGRILHVNAELEKLYGYSREELIGCEIEQLVPERYRARHVEHRERYCLDPKRRQMGMGLEIVGRRRDGSEFPAEMSLSPIDTDRGLVVASTIRDITARKTAEKALRESEDRPKLFQRYRSLAASRSGSSGLGLFIVKTIVEAHGGSVQAEFPSAGGPSSPSTWTNTASLEKRRRARRTYRVAGHCHHSKPPFKKLHVTHQAELFAEFRLRASAISSARQCAAPIF